MKEFRFSAYLSITDMGLGNLSWDDVQGWCSVERCKQHLIVEHNEDDELIKNYLLASWNLVETTLERSLIDLVSEYGGKVPPSIVNAVLLLVGRYYNSREGETFTNLREMGFGIAALLMPFKGISGRGKKKPEPQPEPQPAPAPAPAPAPEPQPEQKGVCIQEGTLLHKIYERMRRTADVLGVGIDELNDFEVNNVIVDFNYDAKVKEILGEGYLEYNKEYNTDYAYSAELGYGRELLSEENRQKATANLKDLLSVAFKFNVSDTEHATDGLGYGVQVVALHPNVLSQLSHLAGVIAKQNNPELGEEELAGQQKEEFNKHINFGADKEVLLREVLSLFRASGLVEEDRIKEVSKRIELEDQNVLNWLAKHELSILGDIDFIKSNAGDAGNGMALQQFIFNLYSPSLTAIYLSMKYNMRLY